MDEKFDQKEVKECVAVLKRGGIIIYPTDTIWGIGCDASNPEAVAKIYNLKKRNEETAMILLVDDAGKIERYVRTVPEIAYDLIEVSDKPLTIVYPNGRNVAANILAKDGSLAIRVTHDPFSRELVRTLNRPVVSTSANPTGKAFSGIFEDIEPEIIEGADYVVKHRQKDRSPARPSQIIRLGEKGEVSILRR